MTTQTITWTALPRGVAEDGRLRLSVHVAPRLIPDGPDAPLSTFPDFVDWPNRDIQFDVSFGGVPAAQVDPDPAAPTPDPAAWQAILGDTMVEGHEFPDHEGEIVESYPAINVASWVKGQWLKFAKTSPTAFPTRAALRADSAFGAVQFFPFEGEPSVRENQLRQQLQGTLQQQRAIPPHPSTATDQIGKDFLEVKLFHAPKNTAREPRPLPLPTIDFHKALAALGDHPDLLRLLGLVRDLLVTPPAVVGPTTVMVTPTWSPLLPPPGEHVDYRPRTRAVVQSTTFLARPRSVADVAGGLLRLNDQIFGVGPKYALLPFDQDGAAIKSMDFANNLQRTELMQTADTPDRYALPTLRSAGLSLARRGSAYSVASLAAGSPGMFKLAKQKNTQFTSDVGQQVVPPGVLLSAEDVTRGYAIDVWDGAWYPLCRRTGEAVFTSADLPAVQLGGEASVRMSFTEASDGTPGNKALPEVMFRWDGWSLGAPRPGKIVDPDERVASHENPPAAGIPLSIRYEAEPGTLPLLRFGRSYRVRARAIDLAGNSVDADVADATGFTHALGPEVYARFEPAPPPDLLMRAARTEGESVEHLVIRSEFPPGAAVSQTERHVVPPKIAATEAEVHGAFDGASGLKAGTFDVVVARQYGNFGEKDASGTFVHQGAVADPKNYGLPYFDEDELTFSLENGETNGVPYLADPIVHGATIRFLPGASTPQVRRFDEGLTWPEVAPFRIRLVGGSGPPVWDPGTRVLTVKLPKADIVEARMASTLDAGDLDKLGLWRWIEDDPTLTDAQRITLRNRILGSTHWMFTPWRTLTLVHAVRQPLTPLKFDHLAVHKTIGRTYVSLDDVAGISRKSTSRVDIIGEWTDVDDFLDESGTWTPRREIPMRAIAAQLPVARTDAALGDAKFLIDQRSVRHELGDTKFRTMRYSAEVLTAFGEYFVTFATVQFNSETEQELLPTGGMGFVEGSETVRLVAPDGTFTRFVRGVDYDVDPGGGKVTRRTGSGIPMNTDVEIRFLPKPVVRSTLEHPDPADQRKSLDVLNSARPDAPNVLYIVPTFGWDRTQPNVSTRVRKRSGFGLRVYLDRPWWSSGDGELLGVVIWPPTIVKGKAIYSPPGERIKPFVTGWGFDPTRRSNPLPRAIPRVADFLDEQQNASGLTLEELPGQKVSVAGYEVGFDQERRLWFADLRLATNSSYFPFVRLALTRFQPKSVPNAHLSRVVLTDFVQLAPDRTATITRVSRSTIEVSVAGISYATVAGKTPAPLVQVTVEGRRDEVPDPDEELGWQPLQTFSLAKQNVRGLGSLWKGQFTVPGSGPLRLVIREFESFQWGYGNLPSSGTRRRLVFAETVEL